MGVPVRHSEKRRFKRWAAFVRRDAWFLSVCASSKTTVSKCSASRVFMSRRRMSYVVRITSAFLQLAKSRFVPAYSAVFNFGENCSNSFCQFESGRGHHFY